MNWQIREMTPLEYRRAIHTLRMNMAQAGRFLGYSERTSRRYADGSAGIPVACALLLRSMVWHDDRPIHPEGE